MIDGKVSKKYNVLDVKNLAVQLKPSFNPDTTLTEKNGKQISAAKAKKEFKVGILEKYEDINEYLRSAFLPYSSTLVSWTVSSRVVVARLIHLGQSPG